MTKVSAPGSREADFSEADIDLGILDSAKVSKKPLGRLKLDASRSVAEPAEIGDADPDTLVELILEGDLRWITTVGRLKTDFPDQVDRSASGERDDDLLLPTHLGRTTLRGGDGDGLKILSASLFDIDIGDLIKELTGDPAAKAGEIAGDILGPLIAKWVDKKIVEAPGLYRLDATGKKKSLVKEGQTLPSVDQPYLLFLHGTFSTTDGSFGGLWQSHPEIWRNITDRYQDRILTLEHHTLAESPIANALDVAEKLPKNAKLHIVSHSRGGLIGELLGRSGRVAGSLFDDVDFEQFDGEGYRDLQKQLEAFSNALFEKKISVERFVRVACPAAGTTLASGRLDRWLSALMNVVGKLGLDAFGLYRFVRGFALAVVETRTEPENIPGLEAMMPGSPLNKILNRPDITTSADLSAIAGDIEGGGIAQRFGVWLTDLFFQGDHDLVVDTASMYGGQQRVPGKSRSYFEDGPDVDHFSYFRNDTSAQKVWDGLRRKDAEENDDFGFSTLPSPPKLKELLSRSGEARPCVFILPGILGSELGVDDDDRIWLDRWDIFRGRLSELDLHRQDRKKIEVFDMLPNYYNALANYLAGSHDVFPFPYDWRISMQDEADRFANALTQQLNNNSQPVRILAHSMGGLVARLAFAQNPGLWRTFKDREGCRLVMLGTPNRGSFSIPRMLMGKERTTGLLALLDFGNREQDLLNMIRRFPGILELLPADSHHDFFDERIWTILDDVDGRGWQEPVQADLAKARETWRRLDGAPVDGAKMVYVAGKADSTPIDLKIERRRVRFLGTVEGDGRVPWETGIPKGIPTFFVRAAHGDLPRHEQAFGAYLDLIQQGSTKLLSRDKPISRGATVPFDMPDDRPEIYPDAETLEAAVLGGQARYVRTRVQSKPITIQVCHGDLTFSPFPVMVGHYEQDSLNGSERALDRGLGGRLSKRHQRELYPGPLDTAEVIIDDVAFPPGAVVIGLGQVGSLATGGLKRALRHGLRRYILTTEEKQRACEIKAERQGGDDEKAALTPPSKDLGLSTLIIGSGDGGLGIEDAISALLDTLLDMQRDNELGGLKRVEIIELYEHRAISTMRALEKLRQRPRYDGRLDLNPDLKISEGGVRQLVLEDDKGWWQRIEIKDGTPEGNEDPNNRSLHFAVITGRARIEDSVVANTLTLADAFIDAAVAQSTFGGRASPGRTLFELLLPLRIKAASQDDRDLVLMLDQVAASYPWELLEDTSGEHATPPAVRIGMIRQLHDDRFRQDVVTTSQRSALVVGDPAPVHPSAEFPALDGAVREARTVADLIGRSGYAVDEEIRTRPTSTVATLMSGQYRIVHIAGHGVFEEEIDGHPQTGMVLGDGLFLTTGAVNQLTHVPELVFLNCCYLGKVNAGAEEKTSARFHELAANLATQFIRIGAKAVVAAGWAVADDAANTFATTFYQAMLARHSNFIDAVKEARQQTYMAHPNTNTWGAYQAYGDPAFTLNGKESSGGNGGRSWYHRYEAVLAFEELTQRAQTAMRVDPAALRSRFGELWQRTPRDWWQDAKILAAKAVAAGELGLFQEAIEAYDQAISAEKSDASIKAIEQRANLRARLAVRLAKGKAQPKSTPSPAPLDMIITSWQELDGLARLQKNADGGMPNVERLNLFGSAAKRASQLYSRADQTAVGLLLKSDPEAAAKKYHPPTADRKDFPDKQIEWLALSAHYYWQAHSAMSEQATAKPNKGYALTNWLTMCALVHIRDGNIAEKEAQPPALAEQDRRLAEAASDAKKADLEKPDFWELAADGDIALTTLLVHAANDFKTAKGKRNDAYKKRFQASVEKRKKAVAKAYLGAWDRGGSVLKMKSISEQLEFIVDALAIGQSESKFERQSLTDAIRSIEEDISRKTEARN